KSKQAGLASINEAIAKSQEAIKQLPEDKALATVVKSLSARQTAVTESIAGLQATLETKKKAIPTIEAERTTVRQAVDAAVTKAKPLRDPVHVADQALVAARAKMMDDVTTLGRYDERIQHLKQLVKLKQAKDLIAVTTSELTKAKSSVAAAR